MYFCAVGQTVFRVPLLSVAGEMHVKYLWVSCDV